MKMQRTKVILRSRQGVFLAAMATGLVTIGQATATLTLRYTFDELSGNAINIANPGTYDGSFNTAGIARDANTPGGISGSSVLSNGTDGGPGVGAYILVGGSSTADPFDMIPESGPGAQVTMTAWFKPTALVSGDVILSNQASGGGLTWQIQNVNSSTPVTPGAFTLQLTSRASGNPLGTELFTNRSSQIDTNFGGSPDWVFLAATFDGSSAGGPSNRNIHFYIGTETGAVVELNNINGLPGTFFSETQSGSDDSGIVFDSTTSLRLGSNPRTAQRTPNAAFDDVRIYTGEALTLGQLEAIRLETGGVAADATWDFDGDGAWSDDGKWSGPVPSGWGTTANFGTIINTPSTVSLDAPRTVGRISISSPIAYNISGGSTLTLDTAGPAFINVTAGDHTISAPLVTNGNLDVAVTAAGDSLTISNSFTTTGSTILKTGDGELQVPYVRATRLVVSDGTVSVAVDGTSDGASRLTSLAVEGTGTLDLHDNDLVIDYTGTSPIQTVRSLLGTGALRSSDADASSSPKFALGYIENTANLSSFNGQTADLTTLIVAYTLAGDSNIDGKVGTLDFNNLAGNFDGGTNKFWFNGDFDYDGEVTSMDFGILVANFGQSTTVGGSPVGQLVPEPSVLGILALLPVSVGRRRAK